MSRRSEDGQLAVSILDSGVGVSPEQIDQIFSAFVTSKPLGTGMGLPISRSIIESHGGRLWATPKYRTWCNISVRLAHFNPRRTGTRNSGTRQTATFIEYHLTAARCGPSFEAVGYLVAFVCGYWSRNSEFLHFGNQRRPLEPEPGRCTARSADNPTSYLQCLQD